MADRQINNPRGAFGIGLTLEQKLGFDANYYVVSGGAVTAKQVVAINTDGTVSAALVGTGFGFIVGITRKAANVGDVVEVVHHGLVSNVPCDGAIPAGTAVSRSATTGGRVFAAVGTASAEMMGTAVSAAAGGFVELYLRG